MSSQVTLKTVQQVFGHEAVRFKVWRPFLTEILLRRVFFVSVAIAKLSLLPCLAQPSSPLIPAITIRPSSSVITSSQPVQVKIEVKGAVNGPPPTGKVVLTNGNSTAPPNLTYLMPALEGMYHAHLRVADLTDVTGLVNRKVLYVDPANTELGSSSGVGATAAGQVGTGFIPFPRSLNVSQPSRIDVHVCIGTSKIAADDDSLTINLSNSGNSPDGLSFSVSMKSITLKMWNVAGMAGYGSASGIPSGTCGSIFVDWLGNGPGGIDARGNEQVWAGWIPDDATDLQAPNNTSIPSSYQKTGMGFSSLLTDSMLSSIHGIYITNASVNTLITGIFVSLGRLDGPVDGEMPAPGLFQPVVLDAGNIIPDYQSNEVWIPPTYGDPRGNPIVQTFHPNGAVSDIRYGRFGVYANLFKAGYILVGVTGDNGEGYSTWGGPTYWDSPTSSSWGGPSGDRYRHAVIDLVRQYLPNGNQYFRMGLSAGAIDALMDEARHPGSSGVAVYSGVTSLRDAWNQAGRPAPDGGIYSSFVSNIQYGWGEWYVALQGNNLNQVPESNSSQWKRISSTESGMALSFYDGQVYAQRGAWNPLTSYDQNDIVVRPYTGTIAELSEVDPSLNFSLFCRVPIRAWAEQYDSEITAAESQASFIDGVTAAGNENATSEILTDCPATDGCHLNEGIFNPSNNQPWNTTTNPSPTLAWFESLRASWPATQSGGSYTSAITALESGRGTIEIPASSLNVGINSLTAWYTPDSAAYRSGFASTSILVTNPTQTPDRERQPNRRAPSCSNRHSHANGFVDSPSLNLFN